MLAPTMPLCALSPLQPAYSQQQPAYSQQQPARLQQQTASTLKAYPVPAAELQSVAAELKRSLAGRNVRISVDARTSQLLVVGPADIQQVLSEQLAAGKLGKSTEVADPNLHTLRNISWKEFEGQLRRVGFVAENNGNNIETARYQIKTPTGGEAHVAVARGEGTVKVAASSQLAPSMRKLAETLDRPAVRPGETSRLVTLDKADPNTVQHLLTYLQSAARPTSPASGKHQHIGEFVSMLFQPGAPPAPPAGPPAGPPAAEGEIDPNDPEAFGSIGPVKIEYIEGLDTIVVTGRKADVDRVMKLIEQIETQSQVTRPEVEVFHLRHVDGRALNDLLTQVYDTIFTARQGRVTIVSLIKPNALLLIGRKENLPAVKELIEKLDRPINGDTELKVFPLKRILSTDAKTKLEALFNPTTTGQGQGAATGQGTGLSTRVNIIADERTNSLIVQASPRDLVEVGKLLESLDGAVSSKDGQIRIVKLRNSLADELVPVIQQALQGEGGRSGNTATQGPGAVSGPAPGANSGSGTQGRSLQLLQVGGNTLQSGVLSDMQITSDPRGNSIIVTGPPENMDLIEALIRQLDELPATEAQIKVYTIVNGDATQLADLLRQLFGQATGTQGGGGNQGLQALLQTATGGGDSALVPLRFSVDVRTNSIVASGSTGDLNVVYKVLVRLDEGNIRERITTVYRLRNAPALEVANSLTQLRQQQQQLNQIAPTLNSAPQTLEKEVIVVPEQVSNSLIVSATPRYFDEIRRVVEELDRRPNMVIIQVLLAEVSLNDLNEFGVELGLQDSLLFDRGVAGVGGLNRIGFPFNQAGIGNDNTPASLATRNQVAPQAISNLGVGRTNASAGFGGLVLSAGNDSVNVLVRALQQSQRMQVLSRPQVQTLDNQPAYVQVGQQVPYITSSNQTQFGIQNQTTFQDVGVILGVTPRTSPDGMIVMEIDAVKSDLGPEAEGIAISVSAAGTVIRQPIINVTRAQTTVSARSGQTVILGGLITRNQTETTRRVPYLGDIPVLGRLFRFDSVDIERTELLIIMTPYVMRTDEHVAWLNMRESERLHWCLADVGNVHGQAQNFTSSGDPGLQTPVIYPDETPAPEGLIAPESIAPGTTPNAWPNVQPRGPQNNQQFPGDPNYNPAPLPMQPRSAPLPIPTAAPQNYVPTPPATPDQTNRVAPGNLLRSVQVQPQPQPNQSTGVPGGLCPIAPLQALPPVPNGPPQFVSPYQQQPPQQVQYGPQPQLQPPPGPQPANYQQQPNQVAPAVYAPQGMNPQYTPIAR
ncbi:secretin N-terminal domain-containing protein [Anatilimnocola floriformis]|uniref:secretin N-terminal domain-containing protein n=1 Tax=Anatilimnocola floriformis TaxID=2948575 RepID=UPI0020C22171|nr:secretin N-terminal domain-containing protein [Anatilimnocola floriformis]